MLWVSTYQQYFQLISCASKLLSCRGQLRVGRTKVGHHHDRHEATLPTRRSRSRGRPRISPSIILGDVRTKQGFRLVGPGSLGSSWLLGRTRPLSAPRSNRVSGRLARWHEDGAETARRLVLEVPAQAQHKSFCKCWEFPELLNRLQDQLLSSNSSASVTDRQLSCSENEQRERDLTQVARVRVSF